MILDKLKDAKPGALVFETEGPMAPLFGKEPIKWYLDEETQWEESYDDAGADLFYVLRGKYLGVAIASATVSKKTGAVTVQV